MQVLSKILIVAILLSIPMVDAALQSIPAEIVLQQVAAGNPIDYIQVNVIGDLNFSKINSQTVKSNLHLINSTISQADFAGVTFVGDAVFWGTSFDNASFEKASFLGRADFSNASFGHADFAGCIFSQPAFFNKALFKIT